MQREAAAAASALSTENEVANSTPAENESAAPVPAENEPPISEATSNEPAAAVAEQMETDETPGEENQEKPVMQDLSQTENVCTISDVSKPEETPAFKPNPVEMVMNDVDMEEVAPANKNVSPPNVTEDEAPSEPDLKDIKSGSDNKGLETESKRSSPANLPVDSTGSLINEGRNPEPLNSEVKLENCAESVPSPLPVPAKEQTTEFKCEGTPKIEEMSPQEQQPA